MTRIKESDWKIFKEIRDKAIDQFYVLSLEEFKEIVNNDSRHPQERYQQLYDSIQHKKKDVRNIFGYLRRSDAYTQLTAIRCNNLADKALLAKLSEEVLKITDPERDW